MLKKDISATLTGEIARLLFGTVSTVVLARGLGPESRGIYALVIWLPTVLAVFLAFGQQQVNSVFAGLYKSERPSLFVQSLFVSLLGATTGCAIVYLYFRLHPAPWGNLSAPLGMWTLSAALVPFMLLEGVFRELTRGSEHIRYAALISTVIGGSQALGLVIWEGLSELTVHSATVVLAGSYGLGIVGYFYRLRKIASLDVGRLSWPLIKESARFGLITAISSGGMMLVNQGATFLLPQFQVTAEEVGLFAVALVFAQKLGMIPNAVAQAFLPRMSNDPTERMKQTPQVYRLTLIACTATMLLLLIAAVPVVSLLLGPEYLGSIPMLVALLPGITLFGASRVLGSYLWVIKKPRYGLVYNWIGAGVLVIIGSVLIPVAGGIGAGISNTIAFMLISACTIWAYRRESGVRLSQLIPAREDGALMLSQLRGSAAVVARVWTGQR